MTPSPIKLALLLVAVVLAALAATVYITGVWSSAGSVSAPSLPVKTVTPVAGTSRRSGKEPRLAVVPTPRPLTLVRRMAAWGPLGLHVHGSRILDRQGRSLRLLGVNRSGSEFKCIQLGTPTARGWGIFDGPTDLSSARAIARWHTNVVRIPLNEDCWLGINGVSPKYGGTSYRMAVKSYVAALHGAGLYAILDLHWSAPGKVQAASQQPMPDQDHAPTFWRSVAATFKRDPNVAFDLYNEPFLYTSYLQDPTEDLWHCWLVGCELNQYLTGGNPYTHGYVWHAAGMQTLVDVVRSTGARNLILVPGLDWANDVSHWRASAPTDPVHNLAVSWHSYPDEICANLECWNRAVAPLARRVPIVVGETGDNVCSPPIYDPTFLPWADRHGLCYLGWTRNPWQDCKNILIRGYRGTPTRGYGQYFHEHLAKLTRTRSASIVPALLDR